MSIEVRTTRLSTIWKKQNYVSCNAQRHLGQLSVRNLIFFCVLTRAWNIWHKVLSRICHSIGCHFKHSFDTLIDDIGKHLQIAKI